MKKGFVFVVMLYGGLFRAQLQFTNNGNFMIHSGGSLSVYGDFINNGSFVDSGSVVTLKGTAAQQIGGASTTIFKNLTLDNSAGSYLSSNQSITGELTITSGTFTTTGYDLKLISDANGTARIAPILGDFAGNITMERYIAGVTDWRFLAAPVTGATINDWQDDFYTTGFPGSSYPSYWFTSIYTYDETVAGTSDNGYIIPASANDQVTPGTGYWCYIGPAPVTVDVTGPPAKFTQTFQVSYTQSGGASEDGYMMIGNPYPCPIDWSSPNWTKNKINDAIYIWNPALQQYASWVSGTAINGGSNLIASSQSFWVQANDASPLLSCNENVKVSANTAFLKPILPAGFDNLKLIIEGNAYKDETLLRFGSTATNGYDSDADARKLFSTNPQVPGIATQDSTMHDMSVNSLPAIQSQVHIPLKTLVGVSGNYMLRVDSSSSITHDFCMVLEDLVTGTKTNLADFTSYSFSINDTTTAARFLIHITAPHETEVIGASCSNYQDGKAIAVAKGAGPWNYTWYNTLNTSIKQTFNSFSADTLHYLSAGSYSVQIDEVNGMCNNTTRQIIISEPAPVLAGFMAMSDTLYLTDSLKLQNTSSGALSYEWSFGDGSAAENNIVPAAHSYSEEGDYQVKLIALHGLCSDTLVKVITVLKANTVRLNENSGSRAIQVYPNPGNGIFYIQMQETENSLLFVYGGAGELLLQQDLPAGKTEINLRHLAKGMYLYRIQSGVRSYSGRLIIQ